MSVKSIVGLYVQGGGIRASGGIRAFGGDEEVTPPSWIYTVSAGSDAAYNFSYPSQKIETVFEGAKIQLSMPDGAVSPVTYSSDHPEIAAIEPSGMMALHNTGTFTISVKDSTGKTWLFSLSPSKYLYPAPKPDRTQIDARNYAASINGKLPDESDLLTMAHVNDRYPGSAYGEWGDFNSNGSNWYTLMGSTKIWTSREEWVANMEKGTAVQMSTTNTFSTVVLLDSKTPGAVLDASLTYTMSPGPSAYPFSYPSQKFMTVFAGAQIQLGPQAGAVAPVTYSSDYPEVASVTSDGLITLHDAGYFNIFITDSTGKKWRFQQQPKLFLVSDGNPYDYAGVSRWSSNDPRSRLPTSAELSAGQGIRKPGSAYGEWGDFLFNSATGGCPFPYTTGSSPIAWSSDIGDSSSYHRIVSLDNGYIDQAKNESITEMNILVFDKAP